MELLVGLNERDGTTVVAVLHDLALAAHFFPRVIVMDGGRIVADGGPGCVAQRAIDPRRVRGGPGARPLAGGRRMSIRDRPGIARPRTRDERRGDDPAAALSMLTRIPVGADRRRRHRRRGVRARRRAGRRHRGDPRRAPGWSGPDPGRDPRGRHPRDRERRAPPGRPGRHRRRAHRRPIASGPRRRARIRPRVRRRGRPGPRARRPGRRARERRDDGRDRRRRRRLHRGRCRLADAPRGRRLGRSATRLRGRTRRLVPRPRRADRCGRRRADDGGRHGRSGPRSPGPSLVPLAVALGSLVGLAVAFGLEHARGQIDGDLLGATVEVGFAAIVGAMAVALNVAWPGL